MTLALTDTRPLGATGLSLPRLGLGTTAVGGLYEANDEQTAIATVSAALSAPHPFIDMAPQYGHGLAELRVGKALADADRDGVVLATKVGRLLRDVEYTDAVRYYFGTPGLNPTFDFSYDGTMRSLEESLSRLGTDRVDILHIHDPDDHYDEALAGAYRALAHLREQGVIKAVGAGMNQSAMLTRFVREGQFDCVLLAGRYTLLEQPALADLLPVASEQGTGIIVGGVYNSGLLAHPEPGAPFNYQPAPQQMIDRAQALRAVCERHGVPLKAAAVQFPFGHPAVISAVIGARTPMELAENIAAAEHPIPADLWDELRDVGLLAADVPTPK